jgi:DNA-binding transcriptional LysR family regulator
VVATSLRVFTHEHSAMNEVIDTQYLRVFATVARQLNLSRAAQELALTPSAVSHCLKALEKDLQCRLLERTSRKVTLTSPGKQLLGEAEEILRRMARARSTLRSSQDRNRGRLHIAANITSCQYLVPPALREFRESFPEFTVKIEPCRTLQALTAIEEGNIDLGIFIEPAIHPKTTFTPICEDELYVLLNPLHPWVLKRKAVHEEFANQNLILPEKGSETHDLIETYFRRKGIRLQPFIEIDSEDAIKQFVRLDLGIGLLPKWIASAEIRQRSIACLPLGRSKLRRRWGVLYRRGRKLTFAESIFVNLCKNVARDLMNDDDK